MVILKKNRQYTYVMYSTLNLISLGLKHKKKTIFILNTKITRQLVIFFLKKGLFLDFIILNSNLIRIDLNYNPNTGKAIFNHFLFISKPGRRRIFSFKDLNKFYKRNSYFGLVLTSYGFLSILDCMRYRIGGELIFITK